MLTCGLGIQDFGVFSLMETTEVFTYTLSTGNVMAIYRQVSAGEAVIVIILMVWLMLEVADLVREHA